MNSLALLLAMALSLPAKEDGPPPCPPTPTPSSASLGVPPCGRTNTHPEPRHFSHAKLRSHPAVRLGAAQVRKLRRSVIVVEVIVSPVGCVLDARLLRGASPLVDAIVLEASRALRFTAAQADHVPVTTYVTVAFSTATSHFSQPPSRKYAILWPD
jgi:hypothetical protein